MIASRVRLVLALCCSVCTASLAPAFAPSPALAVSRCGPAAGTSSPLLDDNKGGLSACATSGTRPSPVGTILSGRRGITTKSFLGRTAPTLARGGSIRKSLRGGGQHLTGLRATASAASSAMQATLATLKFDNSFIRDLPGDPLSAEDKVKNNRPRQVEGAAYSLVLPTAVADPKLLAYSKEAAALIDLPEEECKKQQFADILAGNELFPGSEPMAMCYGGHQFGNWAGQLGDGRAMSLGEVVNAAGDRWELQLKGAGPTPYSRTADGRAVLRSSVREFLCSEAMFHLGVPTTRALSLVLTGDEVVRDMFYDGNPAPEPGAVVCRMAPSFIRFGCFELPASRGDEKLLTKYLDYTLQRDFPQIAAKFEGKEAYVEMLKEMCRTTATMVAHWMRVGYVHGVMNTDNMSVLGLTIDYGPYGWVDNYDPEWTPNTTDGMRGRYKFGNQPGVAFWNLVRFANALFPVVKDVEPLQNALPEFERAMKEEMADMNRQKLGLAKWNEEGDEELWAGLCAAMERQETDMTILFRLLGGLPVKSGGKDEGEMLEMLRDAFYKPLSEANDAEWRSWLTKYAKRVKEEAPSDEERKAAMNKVNPKYVLRNFISQTAIDAAADGDFSLVEEVLEVMRTPYDEQPEFEDKYFVKRPEWARKKAGCSALSCSS
mmetsp:Transcript_15989/g.31619  ORF Transcript_15989/g.31619 Transcript_15989/m.31619 type:complete len:659 (-) Transcript_15989:264-2240(-)|eukprot:CAMPEP_0173391770 /NCGR_PEP_ID=MMETSP1356-20130122/18574_1 /TAXON_ID=77927 ORGANISM="Hemiselmis virescens, Strain PCC157" /NCGR_SAMPLE_ID=MMETSP1356 /ASSEMBLY_ACC=CAM_ASM_000847 /LENGTH=658 /DNA_ID=CAMNT_0014349457 /DNA_START=31 /DNA_END=2007 /DNA_ORIENTATION=+